MKRRLRIALALSACLVVVAISGLSSSDVGRFFRAGGSDVLLQFARPPAALLALSVAGVCATSVAVARRPTAVARVGLVALLLSWVLLGRSVSVSRGTGEIRGYWYFIQTGSVSLRPAAMDVEDYLRDAEVCTSRWSVILRFHGESGALWLGPAVMSSARSLFAEAGLRCSEVDDGRP